MKATMTFLCAMDVQEGAGIAFYFGDIGESQGGLPGKDGQSAYELAVGQGYSGSVDQWLASLRGADGRSAYEAALAAGFAGSEAGFNSSLASIGAIDEVLDAINGEVI